MVNLKNGGKNMKGKSNFLLILIIIILVAVIIVLLVDRSRILSKPSKIFETETDTLKNYLKEESEEQPVEAKVPEPILEKTWKQIMRFSGEGMKTTDTFYISGDKWRVKWNIRPSSSEMPTIIFQIFVNRSNGELVSLAANVTAQGSDYSVIHEKGSFFLEVNSGLAKWGIIIEEWK